MGATPLPRENFFEREIILTRPMGISLRNENSENRFISDSKPVNIYVHFLLGKQKRNIDFVS